jgi:SAM-dependent methyltransferase
MSIQKLIKGFYKSPRLHKFFYIVTAILILNLIATYGQEKRLEGFASSADDDDTTASTAIQTKEFVVKTGPQVYDDFYVNIYDDLVFSQLKNNFEIGEIINTTAPSDKSYILDIGSGTGHHVQTLQDKGFKAVGIDVSVAMIKKAKETYPEMDYRLADALTSATFPASTFTHITCLYFTIYYIKNKRQFFTNCLNWLMPGGFLVLHLVDRENFDPIIPSGNPFGVISPQNYASERITTSLVKFDQFDYKANFVLNSTENTAILNETFTKNANNKKKNANTNNNNKNIRKNEHTFYIPTQQDILSIAKDAGFIMHAKIDMLQCQYDHQYLYILQKPN